MKTYLVKRRIGADVFVQVMKNRKTGLYQFVNLTKGHICECEFESMDGALQDMDSDENVISYEAV